MVSFLEGLSVFVVHLRKGWIERFRYKKFGRGWREKMERRYC